MFRTGPHGKAGHGYHRHLAPAAGKSYDLHLKIRIAVGGVCVGRPPVGHDNRSPARQKIRPLRLDGLADQGLLRVNIAAVDQLLKKLKSRAHVIAVPGLPAVERGNLRFRIPPIVQIRIGLGEHKGLQPPAVGPHGGVHTVFLEHPAALQKLLRGVGQLQAILPEHVHIDKQAVGHHLLGDRHQLSVHRVGNPNDLPQVLRAVQPRQVHQPALRTQGQNGVGVEQIQVVHIVSGPVQGHLVIGLVLVVFRRIGLVSHRHPQPLLRHGYGQVRRGSGHIFGVRVGLFHGAEHINHLFALFPARKQVLVLPVYAAAGRRQQHGPRRAGGRPSAQAPILAHFHRRFRPFPLQIA